jgi:hypothetical protein
VILDDLEIPNTHTPEVVVQAFRDATKRHVQGLRASNPYLADRVADALQSKASFHLAAPMVEAWLFADPDGLRNAKVPELRLPANWEQARDPEAFLTQDPDYIDDDCSKCSEWQTLTGPKQKDHKPAWLRLERERHPKAFLAWLSRQPSEKKCSAYRETHEGADALKILNWRDALRSREHCKFMRALIADLADGLGEMPFEMDGGSLSPHTSHRRRHQDRILRNI